MPSEQSTVGWLRAGVLLLGGLGLVGTAAQLALDRHWDSTEQLIPWVGVALNIVAFGLVLRRPGTRRAFAARGLAIVVFVIAAVGVWRHANANYEAGPLDRNYTDRWESMSETDRWFRATVQSVGPAPTLAAGALAETALAVLIASMVVEPRMVRRSQ
ncbi:MAG: hypothetical protein R3C39_01560 [Dehalococcoidia bacterium]